MMGFLSHRHKKNTSKAHGRRKSERFRQPRAVSQVQDNSSKVAGATIVPASKPAQRWRQSFASAGRRSRHLPMPGLRKLRKDVQQDKKYTQQTEGASRNKLGTWPKRQAKERLWWWRTSRWKHTGPLEDRVLGCSTVRLPSTCKLAHMFLYFWQSDINYRQARSSS